MCREPEICFCHLKIIIKPVVKPLHNTKNIDEMQQFFGFYQNYCLLLHRESKAINKT
jgi:hypothetical protein